jgi:hypothetical protein
MNALPLALSLSNSFTKLGAIAAFAALFGIALLALLVFTQAREIKRLREWAGRAPERAAELEQRAGADAAARVQRPLQPASAARVIPRKTPLVSAPVSTAVNATVAGALPAAVGPPQGESSVVGAPQASAGASTQDTVTPPANSGVAAPVAASADTAPSSASDPLALSGGETGAKESPSTPAAVQGGDADKPVPAGAVSSQALDTSSSLHAEELSGRAEEGTESEGKVASAPATAAARAVGVAARSPLPPPPSAPVPSSMPSAPRAAAATPPGSQTPPAVPRPPAPVVAASRRSSRAPAGSPAGSAPARPPSPTRGETAAAARATRPDAASAGPKYFRRERSPARATVLIVGAVIVGVLLLVLAVSALKGGGAKPASTTAKTRPLSSHKSPSAAVSPAVAAVTVLNGTSTNGLAHHLAADLQQSGYAHAEASAAVPPGTHATTIVEYTPGHRAEAEGVAKALDVTRVQPISGTTASLASSAMIVVVAGADQAALLGEGGAQSQGGPAAGAAGTGEAGGGEAAAGGEAGTGATGAGAGESAAGTGQ